MSRPRWEARRTFRTSDRPSGSWMRISVVLCLVTGRMRVVETTLSAPAHPDGAGVARSMGDVLRARAGNWRAKEMAR